MQVVFVNQQNLRLGIGIILLGLLALGFWLNSEHITRRIMGVKSGVCLEGSPVAGMLPEEVTEFVAGLAEQVNREPQEAGYFAETGEIIPARAGRRVCVAATVRRVCRAKPGQHLRILTITVPPRISESYFQAIYHGSPKKPQVALAVNVAWGEEYLPQMLKVLAGQKVKVTFFMVGSWVKNFPELFKIMVAGGHEIANHGLYHGHPLQMNQEELRRLIVENETLLSNVLGHKPAQLFAPPYGEINPRIVAVAAKSGYRTIMWSVDTLDWKNPTPESLLQRVLAKIGPGAIILMHPTIASREALLPLIQALKKRGLKPVTVSEVLK
jgi:probable sporulation protein (polysaccharide deacetylase family)